MRTIDKLALRDEYWQKTALTICKDKDLAKDLVQEMYIKLCDSNFYSDWYVINTIRNLFIDTIRANRLVVSDELVAEGKAVQSVSEDTFELSDEDDFYLRRYYDLGNTKQELIEESYYKSDREIGKEFNINYGYVHKKRIEGIKEILGNAFGSYRNSNLKYLITKEDEPEKPLTDEEFNNWVDEMLTKNKMTDKEFEEWINKVIK